MSAFLRNTQVRRERALSIGDDIQTIYHILQRFVRFIEHNMKSDSIRIQDAVVNWC